MGWKNALYEKSASFRVIFFYTCRQYAYVCAGDKADRSIAKMYSKVKKLRIKIWKKKSNGMIQK